MKNFYRKFYPLLFIIAVIIFRPAYNGFAQNNFRFDHLTIDDGLSHAVILDIFQDKNGFLWFGTQDGLNKYDGYKFYVYKNDPHDSTSIKDNWIQVIEEDSSGNLWIGTSRNGVFIFDPDAEVFTNLKNEPKNPNSLLSNRIWSIFIEDTATVWIGTSKGLDKYDITKKEFTHYVNVENDSLTISKGGVNEICKDLKGNLWIGVWHGGLNKFDKITKEFTRYYISTGNSSDIRKNKVKSVKNLSDNYLLVGTNQGLLKFNKEKEIFEPFTDSSMQVLNTVSVQSILLEDNGKVWVGTHHNGLFYINLLENTLTQMLYSPTNPDGISDNWIHSIVKDRTGNIWIGSGKGINKFSPFKQNFINIKHNPYNPSGSLAEGEVLSVIEDTNNVLWIGTWNGGLDKYDRKTGTFTHYIHNPDDEKSLPNNIVWTIFIDSNKDLWVGTYDGLAKFDREKESFEVFKHDYNDPSTISYNNISCIYEDSRNNLWIGTWGGGLNLLNRDSLKFKRFLHSPEHPNTISENVISVIYEDSRKNLWIGTNSGGLNLYNYNKNDFTHFLHDEKNKFSLSNNAIKSILEDKFGNLWIGTIGGGLNKFVYDNNNFYSFTETEGLANNSVQKIIDDNYNHLWISTNKGLSRLELNTLEFNNYYESDGLVTSQLSSAGQRLKDGSIVIGGLDGLTFFDPEKITINKLIPLVAITSIRKFNEEVKFKEEIKKFGKVKLNYNENTFAIEFAALDYSNPQKNQYAYRLEGFNDSWIYNGNKRVAYYTNIDPGIYTFHVKASNNDGVWNEAGASVVIEIVPPFWLTLWFRALVILLVTGLIFWVFRIRIKSVERQNIKLEKLVKRRTLELENEINARKKTEAALRKSEKELRISNKNKDKFFSIIAHDLKSPFSSLLGYSEWLQNELKNLSKEEIQNAFENMNRSIRKVYELIQNLLEWARIQNGKIEFNPSSFDIKKLIDNTIGFIEFKAMNKDIKIENRVRENLFVYADQNMLTSVLQNLLTNALKFNYPGGKVTISARISNGFVEVSIHDTGVGISQENLDKLFRIDVHHTTVGTSEERGTGLGLILCKELIERNHGKIWCESKKGEGSTFTFTVPLTSAIYKIKKNN